MTPQGYGSPHHATRTRDRIMACFGSASFEWSAMQIHDMTGLGPASVYPSLYSLERLGVLESRWLDGPFPRCRLYRLGTVPYAGRQEVLPYE